MTRPDFCRQPISSGLPSSTSAGGWAMPPTGDVSVMPQPWMMRTPYFFSKAFISASGMAAPPDVPIRSDDRSIGWVSPYCRMPAQIVGTAEASVERSAAMKSVIGPGIMCGPGKCSVAPDRNAPNGMPQALTWNIGTKVSTRSDSTVPVTDAASVASACRYVERCE